eukprot:CAMPEP_0184478374 /NCGR_PEP_ID=MMETSP0113_2-20130426/421_1 /TAXON_ID=91329 /ORGANISM="Norrisiella sphaerica, Strain BC52" /LENGTH=275 /DNA_ID=CAMNT_0026856141 /DNA_START=248 /DNA_END=1075 /DNA_ORIENTATION=+
MTTQWFKLEPFFEMQMRQRKTTKKVESTEDLDKFDELTEENQTRVNKALENYLTEREKPKPKVKRAKRKTKNEDGKEKKSTPKKKKAKIENEGKPNVDLFAGVNPECTPKEAAKALLKVAEELKFNLPKDETDATIRCGQQLMGNKTDGKFDFMKALKSLANEMQCPEKVPGQKAKKKRPAPVAAMEENQGLVECFWELGNFEFKNRGDKFKGINYHKVCRALAGLDFKVTSGAAIAKGKKKVAGIGASSGKKIDEYLETGKIDRLERFRVGDFS